MSNDAELAGLLESILGSRENPRRESDARQLVEKLYPLVIRIVRSHLPRRETEEDMAQEIFMKMFARLHQYRADRPFEHWVSRIAVTTCIDHLRAQKARPELRWGDLSSEQAECLDTCMADQPATHPPDTLAARELVHQLLATLNPQDRLILQWLDLDQIPVEEIRQRTGWGASFIKVRAFRARAKLRSKLQSLEQKNHGKN